MVTHVSKRRWLGVAVAAVLIGLGLAVPGQAGEPPARPLANAKTVTLLTGDKVRIAPRGNTWDLRVEPRWGEPVAFTQRVEKDHAYVIPSDAAKLIAKGTLDERLFDVAGLVAQGYDDASRTSLPLLTTRPPAGATITRKLSRTGLTAMVAPKKDTATLWQRLKAGKAHVWLDAKVRPLLDQSVPKIGAPTAWAAGFTGKGVNVAVLDTGLDADHPDLAGKVAGSRDFTGEGTNDTIGHGTHVASTIVGSGAASNGRYKGVAPDAKLLVGKVLGQEGGLESWVIAGMEWAAAEGARVANLSLGTYFPADQSDPVAQAVNRLSADTKTLYVIAAGNLGDGDQTIASPGSAAAALTVGSASKTDVLSVFSSRGPVVNDYRVKPDLVAPGESIVAARAKGTLDEYAVDEHYARLDGTSMATPHASGAAAILVQQHPDWDGEDVKAALTGSAEPIADATVYGQGAGRLDVGRASGQNVRTDAAAVDLGILRWPHDGGAGTKQVSYRNDGDTPVTLSLALTATGADGEPVPAGTLGLAAETLTVPAHGTAQATVTYDLKKARLGQLGGWLTATSADGVRLRTSVGGYLEPEMYDVKLGLTNRDGQPARSEFDVLALYGKGGFEAYGVDGDTVRLAPGRYVAHAQVVTPRPRKAEESVTFLAKPAFEVKANGSITLDARQAKRLRIETPKREARHTHLTLGGSVEGFFTFYVAVPENYDETYVGRSGAPASDYHFYARTLLSAPEVTLRVTRPERLDVETWWVPDSPVLAGRNQLPLVDGGRGKAADIERIDVRGKLVVVAPEEGDELGETTAAVRAGGGKAVLVWLRDTIYVPEDRTVPIAYSSRAEMERLIQLAGTGKATVDLRGIRYSPYRYDLTFPSTGQPPATTTFKVRDRQLAAVTARYLPSWDGPVSGYQFADNLDQDAPIAGWCCGSIELPAQRTEYYQPGTWGMEWNWIAWDGTEAGTSGHRGSADPVRLRAGQRVAVTWGGPVHGPAFPQSEPEYVTSRSGDQVRVDLPLLADGEGHADWPEIDQHRDGDVSTTRLYRDGKLVGSSEIAGFGSFTVPVGPAELRLETDFARVAEYWQTSTRVQARWTVRSEGDGVLPLLAVRYRPAAVLSGRVRGGTPYLLPVSVQRQVGAPAAKVSKLAVQASYDDGRTWRKAALVRHGEGWLAVLRHPAHGFVSLRAQATDANGNTVDQTIMRAYRLK